MRSSQSGELRGLCDVVAVIANKADAGGLARAEALGVPTAVVPSNGRSREAFEGELLERLEPLHVDYVVLAGFMRILTAKVVREYPRRIINIHPADPAKYRGPAGYQWAVDNGVEETAITVHYVDEGVDTGEVIAQCSVDLRGATSLEEVEARGLKVEHRFYCEALKELFLKG